MVSKNPIISIEPVENVPIKHVRSVSKPKTECNTAVIFIFDLVGGVEGGGGIRTKTISQEIAKPQVQHFYWLFH